MDLRSEAALHRGHSYVLRIDFQKFFPSVDHLILRRLLNRVTPTAWRWLRDRFLDAPIATERSDLIAMRRERWELAPQWGPRLESGEGLWLGRWGYQSAKSFNGAPDWNPGKGDGVEVLAVLGVARGFASDGDFGLALGTS